jgi:hypothetical protein
MSSGNSDNKHDESRIEFKLFPQQKNGILLKGLFDAFKNMRFGGYLQDCGTPSS